MMHLTIRRWVAVNALLALAVLAAIAASIMLGSERIAISDAFGPDSRAREILFLARMPRTLLAAMVGMALASSGGAFQALLRNPLADPFILGVSGGAALGSVAAIGFHLPFAWISAAAFLGAIASAAIIYAVAGARGRLDSTSLLLTGVIFNAFCFALILFINSVVTMEEAYQIIFLLIGNLEAASMAEVGVVAAFILFGFAVLCSCAGRMNALSLGDEDARAIGVDVARLRAVIFIAASVMVGAAVAASGLIGFIGLFIPHIVRLAFGADNRLLIPASGLAGAAFLAAADLVARTLLMGTPYATELPVGVITALVGAPMFMVMLRRRD